MKFKSLKTVAEQDESPLKTEKKYELGIWNKSSLSYLKFSYEKDTDFNPLHFAT